MTIKFVIVCSGPVWADPSNKEQWIERAMVAKYDPNFKRGEGRCKFTNELSEAKLFDTIEQARSYADQVPTKHPLTKAGLPNKPIKIFQVKYVCVNLDAVE
jgi:hypothetical protein